MTLPQHRFVYRNWRGEVGERRAIPERLYWGSTEWHPEPQWLMVAHDLDKDATREFALFDVQEWLAGAEFLSHDERDEGQALAEARERCTSETQREIVDGLAESELGRSLIANRGLDGLWIEYVVRYPLEPYAGLGEMERWMLTQAPFALATQARFCHFLDVLQRLVGPEMRLASVPCGMMSDLTMLDYSNAEGVQLVGGDLDVRALESAARGAHEAGLQAQTELLLVDAWDLSRVGKCDVVVSSGLNLYVSDDTKVTALYGELYRTLRPGGVLLTSAPTPPQDWDMTQVVMADLLQQKEILVDVIGAKFQAMRTVELTLDQLQEAGFGSVEVLYDDARMFPTFVARR